MTALRLFQREKREAPTIHPPTVAEHNHVAMHRLAVRETIIPGLPIPCMPEISNPQSVSLLQTPATRSSTRNIKSSRRRCTRSKTRSGRSCSKGRSRITSVWHNRGMRRREHNSWSKGTSNKLNSCRRGTHLNSNTCSRGSNRLRARAKAGRRRESEYPLMKAGAEHLTMFRAE